MTEFEKKFPKPNYESIKHMLRYNSQREGWLAALKWIQHDTGIDPFGKIAQEIKALEHD